MLVGNSPRRITSSGRERGARLHSSVTGRALVADAEREARELSAAALGRIGFDVSKATTGAQALTLARCEPPLLAVLEVRLPDVSGLELATRLRDELSPPPSIIFTSSDRTEPMDCVACLLLGADDYLVKPVDPDELLARARAVLLRRARSRPGSASDP